jgi:molecular chaperone GrpE
MSKKKPELEERVAELTADLQRVQADFVNFRRRAEAERGAILDLAKQDVVLQLLPLLDNLDRALGHLPAELAGNDWARGVGQVAKQAAETIKKLGVEKIAALGQPFDHNLHEAIATDDSGSHEVVVEELQPGYKLGDKVIRPAIVKVGKEEKRS